MHVTISMSLQYPRSTGHWHAYPRYARHVVVSSNNRRSSGTSFAFISAKHMQEQGAHRPVFIETTTYPATIHGFVKMLLHRCKRRERELELGGRLEAPLAAG